MTEKRYSHDGIVIVDHLKKDLIDIDGKRDLLELAEYVDTLQEENQQLKKENKKLQGKYDKQLWLYNGLGCEYDSLKEENKQLKHRIKKLQNELNNCEEDYILEEYL